MAQQPQGTAAVKSPSGGAAAAAPAGTSIWLHHLAPADTHKAQPQPHPPSPPLQTQRAALEDLLVAQLGGGCALQGVCAWQRVQAHALQQLLQSCVELLSRPPANLGVSPPPHTMPSMHPATSPVSCATDTTTNNNTTTATDAANLPPAPHALPPAALPPLYPLSLTTLLPGALLHLARSQPAPQSHPALRAHAAARAGHAHARASSARDDLYAYVALSQQAPCSVDPVGSGLQEQLLPWVEVAPHNTGTPLLAASAAVGAGAQWPSSAGMAGAVAPPAHGPVPASPKAAPPATAAAAQAQAQAQMQPLPAAPTPPACMLAPHGICLAPPLPYVGKAADALPGSSTHAPPEGTSSGAPAAATSTHAPGPDWERRQQAAAAAASPQARCAALNACGGACSAAELGRAVRRVEWLTDELQGAVRQVRRQEKAAAVLGQRVRASVCVCVRARASAPCVCEHCMHFCSDKLWYAGVPFTLPYPQIPTPFPGAPLRQVATALAPPPGCAPAAAALAGGHLLVTGPPGSGKSALAQAVLEVVCTLPAVRAHAVFVS